MALNTITTEGLPSPIGPQLRAAVSELQGLTIRVVAGAAARTNIAISGLKTTDTIVSVIQLDIDTATVRDAVDLTTEASIPTTGNLQVRTTVTTGDKLLVVYFSKPA